MLVTLAVWGGEAVHAGAVTSAAERSAARAAATRSAPAAKSAAERAALQALWRQLDQKTLNSITKRYGQYIEPRRLEQALKSDATIMGRDAFDAYLKKVAPKLSEAERKEILGVYLDHKVTLDGQQVDVPLTVAHERLHQLANPRFRQALGDKLDEGVTELMARQIYRDLSLADAPKVYPDNVKIANMLRARVGEERLARAYLEGDIGPLRHIVDADLGRGRFDQFARAGREGNLDLAMQLLR